ncbi:MAG: tail fiber domain-containing protein, partial [Hymenobacter sp.]|nr:tail fiber domain-containing protein [Hymenobacter sp.]
GTRNTFEGLQAGRANTTGTDNTYTGHQAGRQLRGSGNVALGSDAGLGSSALTTTIGVDNVTLVGSQAGRLNTADGLMAIGYETGIANTGLYNQFIGYQAGRNNTSGGGNTLMGYAAGNALNSGDDNTFVGRLAGTGTTSGSRLTLLGYDANASSNGLSFATAIGPSARVGASNTMAFGSGNVLAWVFGRASVANSSIALQVGTDSGNGNGAYLTEGGVWTNVSDVNLKENIERVESAQVLGLIRQLPLSRWAYKGTRGETHLGPMAQDFYRLFHLGLNDTSISTIDPAGVALVGVQELAKQNDQLRAENAQLRQQLQAVQAGQATLDARLATLEHAAQLAAPVAQASR